jgi:pimeloyl-ACP methyl ester carboxylesterase
VGALGHTVSAMPRLERDGFELHYEVAGRGFPLFLLTGAGCDASVWRRSGFVSLLERQFACVLFDSPGVGQSSVPAEPSAWAVDAIAGNVVALADHLGFDRFALWGASAGGSVAMVVAVEHPGQVVALVLSSAWPADYEPWREWFGNLAAQFRAVGGPELLTRVYEEEGGQPPEWFAEAAQYGEIAARYLERQLGYDWAERAMPEQVLVPTLILVGEQEDPNREAEAAAAQMADGKAVYFPGLGHVGNCLASAESVQQALPFLQRVTAAG